MQLKTGITLSFIIIGVLCFFFGTSTESSIFEILGISAWVCATILYAFWTDIFGKEPVKKKAEEKKAPETEVKE